MTRVAVNGEAVVRATQEGRLLYRDAFVLTDLHGDTFARYAARLGAAVRRCGASIDNVHLAVDRRRPVRRVESS